MCFQMRTSTLIIFFLILSSCSTPKLLESRYQAIGEKCLEIGQDFSEAKVCLEQKGVKNLKNYNEFILTEMTCKPTWWFPIMAACADIKIELDSKNKIKAWETEGLLDGI